AEVRPSDSPRRVRRRASHYASQPDNAESDRREVSRSGRAICAGPAERRRTLASGIRFRPAAREGMAVVRARWLQVAAGLSVHAAERIGDFDRVAGHVGANAALVLAEVL